MDASNEPRKSTTPARDVLYAEAAKYAPRAIEVLVDIMENGDNSNAKMGAAKAILAKAIPDLKVMEITGENGGAIQLIYKIDMAGGYIPPLGASYAPPTTGFTGSPSVQGTSVAPASTQDDNSDNGDSQAGTV